MLTLLVPILISYLVETPKLAACSVHSQSLHDYALSRLMTIGPQYPTHFRSVMAAGPDMRSKLEEAVKNKQLNAPSGRKSQSAKKDGSQPTIPKIKLKTDFSNFAG